MKLCDVCGRFIDRKYGDEAERYASDIWLNGPGGKQYEFDICTECNRVRREGIEASTEKENSKYRSLMVAQQERFRQKYGGDGIPDED
jgi:hypothetical protein